MTGTALIGIAGVHFVVSELSRRGIVALPTVKNTAAYDIVAINVKGTRNANIQVKASQNAVSFFPMPLPEKVRCGRNDYYVFVRWRDDDQRFEGFLLKGREAKKAVEETIQWQMQKIREGTRKKLFPALYIDGERGKNGQKWKMAWETWAL